MTTAIMVILGIIGFLCLGYVVVNIVRLMRLERQIRAKKQEIRRKEGKVWWKVR